jgi:hypothetical protein
MDRRLPHRARLFRQRARLLTEAAERERDKGRRWHLLELAETYLRTADGMAPAPRPWSG